MLARVMHLAAAAGASTAAPAPTEAASVRVAADHISGAQLAMGVAAVAMDRWGRLAKMVLNYWGVKTTRDLGEIVYLMIRHEWMTAQETDRIEDFDGVFEFETLFERDYDFEIR